MQNVRHKQNIGHMRKMCAGGIHCNMCAVCAQSSRYVQNMRSLRTILKICAQYVQFAHILSYILSRKKTNQTRSILLQFTQNLHLLTGYHQAKTLISRFFLLMPLLLRNGSFLFVLQSQPFYLAQLVPVTTISIPRSSL